LRVIVCPVRVPGSGAGGEIAQALRDVNTLPDVDVVIAGRGGGSLEDLWAFNEESVARAIAASRIPVVSAVGHETDYTIADLVADRRAATPTAAASLVVPAQGDLQTRITRAAETLCAATRRRVRTQRDRVASRAAHLRDPRSVLRTLRVRIDELEQRAHRSVQGAVLRARERTRAAAQHLDALSPLAVLERGYSIARRVDDGTVVRDAGALRKDERLRLTFAQGEARVRVEE
jgi:exodeoxyribonuclease VII large subunit